MTRRTSDESEMTESTQPSRDQELEKIVDDLDENVMGEREAKDVPGKPSERAKEPREGSAEEPTD
ncbi:MAG: hypothetical protein ACM4D3_10205 [Candidatus Sericytochromatia bacterium]|jgi:hypothetical protein